MNAEQVQIEVTRAQLTLQQLLAVADEDVRRIEYSVEQGAIRLQCSDFVHAQKVMDATYTETLRTARSSLMGRVLPRMVYHYEKDGTKESLRFPLNV